MKPCYRLESYCAQVFWIVFNKNSSYPKDDNSGHKGRKAYEGFLAEAQKGVSEKHIFVPAKAVGAAAGPKRKKKSQKEH